MHSNTIFKEKTISTVLWGQDFILNIEIKKDRDYKHLYNTTILYYYTIGSADIKKRKKTILKA